MNKERFKEIVESVASGSMPEVAVSMEDMDFPVLQFASVIVNSGGGKIFCEEKGEKLVIHHKED